MPARCAVFLLLLIIPAAFSQTASPCRIDFPPIARDANNIFSPAQEVDLGDAVAELLLPNLLVLSEDDPGLHRIASRLVERTPLASLRVRPYIIDIPQTNAFVIPGGRIYVSRALIALMTSEDELAGVVAHELGHLFALHQAAAFSARLKSALGVTAVTGRTSIFDALSRLVETPRKVPAGNHDEQVEADRFGLLIMAAAGYDPAAQIRAFDRLAQTKGKTGGFMSDLFRATTPESRRLREMLKSVPEPCAATASSPASGFSAWRSRALALTHRTFRESLSGVQWRKTLQPRLAGDLSQLRFSPDGSYVLAADASGVTVLGVAPLQALFRAPYTRAGVVEFTPDSREIVFLSSGTHVERWSVSDRIRTGVSEIPLRRPCFTERLSPDGRTLACVDGTGDLELIDVATAETLLHKDNFGRVSYLSFGNLSIPFGSAGAAAMDFSPDGKFFLAAADALDGSLIAWNLEQRAPVNIAGELKKLRGQRFAFLTTDRVVAAPRTLGSGTVNGVILSFPGGALLAKTALPSGPISRAADSRFVVVHSSGQFGTCAVELGTGLAINTKLRAIDIRGDRYVAERRTGELGLYERGKSVIASMPLPQANLQALRTFALSPNFAWLAVSAANRSAIWDLASGAAAAQFGPLNGAHFDGASRLLLDMPREGERDRNITEVDMAAGKVVASRPTGDVLARLTGPHLLVTKREDNAPPRYNIITRHFEELTFDVRDATTLKTLWTRTYRKEAPRPYCDPGGARSCLFFLGLSTSTAAEILRQDKTLQARVPAADRPAAYLVETVDMVAGTASNRMVLNLVDPSLAVTGAFEVPGGVVVEDNRNRVLVFSAASPEPRLRFFGRLAAIDAARGRLAVAKEPGHLVLYDSTSGTQVSEFRFPGPVILVRFRDDGRALFALTSEQEAISLEVR